ncbi:unnamed protein product [Prorocentrum cordatum]|uniref:Kinase n=1 Tax=Prorocentrum cordatum TaxID=2364126 RepID=A0ABN9Y8C1_9DINO|nr:unnamed protein product [Polarella glacialis]
MCMTMAARAAAGRHGHLTPVWNYTSLGQPYPAQASEEDLEFRVLDGSSLFRPVLCGVARRPLRELVDAREAQQLALLSDGEETGTITVHVSVAKVGEGQRRPRSEADLTYADPALFETPVARLPVSGGTAPFFQLRLRATERSPTYYIGKDLAHTQDEVQFYEDALALTCGPADEQEGLGGLLGFMFEYLGILQAREEGSAEDAEPRKMLVLRNLFDGCTALRMLDIKIGQKTAAAGHHGKSRFKAWLRGIVDPLTNSGSQGFRLAGFNGQPLSYTSRDPIIAAEALGAGSEDVRKKAGRMMLSQVRGDEMLLYFLDTRQLARTVTGAPGELAPSELIWCCTRSWCSSWPWPWRAATPPRPRSGSAAPWASPSTAAGCRAWRRAPPEASWRTRCGRACGSTCSTGAAQT